MFPQGVFKRSNLNQSVSILSRKAGTVLVQGGIQFEYLLLCLVIVTIRRGGHKAIKMTRIGLDMRLVAFHAKGNFLNFPQNVFLAKMK